MKDSGERETYTTGMVREPEDDRPRFDLCVPIQVPYEHQLATRFARHMATGAKKYTERNWEKARTEKEYNRYKSSAYRHFMQWFLDEQDGEDHAAAIMFNLLAAETVKYHLSVDKDIDG